MTFDEAKECFVKDFSVTYKHDLSSSAWRIIEMNEFDKTLMIQRLTDAELLTCNAEDITRRGTYSYKYFLYRFPKREIYSNSKRKETDKYWVF